MTPAILDVDDVADLLSIKGSARERRRRVYYLTEQRYIPFLRIGRRLAFPKDAVMAFLLEQTVPAKGVTAASQAH